MTKTVVGRPHIITENFDDISTYFGLIKCTVLPPRGLFHPVLPYRTQGKLMLFPLCKTCADTCNQTHCTHSERERAIQGTWCSVELEKALEKGYRILQMHEVWHFPETSDACSRIMWTHSSKSSKNPVVIPKTVPPRNRNSSTSTNTWKSKGYKWTRTRSNTILGCVHCPN